MTNISGPNFIQFIFPHRSDIESRNGGVHGSIVRRTNTAKGNAITDISNTFRNSDIALVCLDIGIDSPSEKIHFKHVIRNKYVGGYEVLKALIHTCLWDIIFFNIGLPSVD